MSFEAALKSHLQADAPITALVGERIFPLIMPQGGDKPAITYQVVSVDQVSHLAGRAATLRNIRLQLDIWGKSFDTVLAIDAAVRTRMDTAATTFRAVLSPGGQDDYEPETKLYRRMLEFSCWFNET